MKKLLAYSYVIFQLAGCCHLKVHSSYGNYTVSDGIASGIMVASVRHSHGVPDVTFPFYVTVLKKFTSANGIIMVDIVIQHVSSNKLTIPLIFTDTAKNGKIRAVVDTVVLQRAF